MTPGITNTGLTRYLSPLVLNLTAPLRYFFMKSSDEGGSEIVYAASREDQNGKYFGERKLVNPSDHCQHNKTLENLYWDKASQYFQQILQK